MTALFGVMYDNFYEYLRTYRMHDFDFNIEYESKCKCILDLINLLQQHINSWINSIRVKLFLPKKIACRKIEIQYSSNKTHVEKKELRTR